MTSAGEAEASEKKLIFRQVLVALGPIFIHGGLGMAEGYSAILLPQLEDDQSTIDIDQQLSSLIASMSALPMAAGSLLGGYLMEIIGRKGLHMLGCIPLIIGWFIIAFSPNVTMILIGRFFTGISDGMLGPPTPVYIAETVQPKIRGVLVMSTTVSLTMGLLWVHFLGTYLNWRLTAIISGLLPITCFISMIFMPESPTFLVKTGKIKDAQKAFFWCRGNSEESHIEFDELVKRQTDLNDSPSVPISQKLKNLYKPELWKPTLIISVFFITYQMTGNQSVISYTVEIVQEAGLNGDSFNEYSAMLIMDFCRVISSILSCVLVDKMARRSLAMLSAYGVVAVLFSLCVYLSILPKLDSTSAMLLLAFLVAYVSLIVLGLMPVAWTMMGEVFPLAYRGLGAGITSSVCFCMLYLTVLTFPYLLNTLGSIARVFGFYGVSALCGTIFLTIYLPETKDKPLYMIEDNFKDEKGRSLEDVEDNQGTVCLENETHWAVNSCQEITKNDS